ncbi:MAG: arylsulfatase [Pirellulales bacterium]|nr:arylsulfatase [Pirellulales bacterium]
MKPTVLAAIACVSLFSAVSHAADPPKPNIVLVLADDMGHGHVSCLNPRSKVSTPNTDRLAREGITLTDAHSGSAVCSPTRYGLLTGRYAWRTRLVRGVLGPYDPPLIEKDRLTLPELLRRRGYHTACVGKWHLGWDWPREGKGDPDFTQPIAGGPTTRGFDAYFGTDVPNYPPYCFLENDCTIGDPTSRKTEQNLDGRPGPMLPGWKFDEILPQLAERAAAYISERSKAKQPFFLYFPLTSPHEPIAPSKPFRGKSGLNGLADFLLETDAVVGRVLEAIDAVGAAGNTLVIFTADNGSSMYTGGEELRRKGHEPSAEFRGFKASIYEGGHRVPFFARWPGKIAPGSSSQETICLTDMVATAAAIVGTTLPDDAGEDSYNVLPVLLGQERKGPVREATVHQSASGQLAIRQGSWKLILPPAVQNAGAGRRNEPATAELYNLSEDVAETKNVYSEQPEVVGRLTELLEQYRRTGRSRP